MKLVVLLPALVGLVAAQVDLPPYVTENDFVDIDAVIADLDSLRAYVDCFLDKGSCTSLTQSFKDIIRDTVVRACDRCNVPQKLRYSRFILALRTILPQDYQEFRQKYDPENTYFDAFEAELSKFWNVPLEERLQSNLNILQGIIRNSRLS